MIANDTKNSGIDLRSILLLATLDTKGEEAHYILSCLRHSNLSVTVMDGGIMGIPPFEADISRFEVAAAGGMSLKDVQNIGHEGRALEVMKKGAEKLAVTLFEQGKIGGVISLGGSMGTTLGTSVMRRFPIGFPKVMISTMASRDTHAFVGTRDILMLHSVCDLAGLNRITKKVLRNGAMAMAGMLNPNKVAISAGRPLVLISTLGTTEFCAQEIRRHLEKSGKETVVFHTVGSGGKAMEEMMREEKVAWVIDLSLHEIMDHHFGGDYDAGPNRGSIAIKEKIPCIMAPGNTDFLVTGTMEKAVHMFPKRPLHAHNTAITLVRASPEEMGEAGRIVAELCNGAAGPCEILVPEKGFSAFDREDSPLFNEKGRRQFIDMLEKYLMKKSRLTLLSCHINDPEFYKAVLARMESAL